MPRFTIERNWIECIGHLWMGGTAAKRIDLSAHDVRHILDIAHCRFEAEGITRDAVAHWLSLNEGDFQGVDDFAAYITDAPDMPWADEESEFTYSDCMGEY